MFAVSVKKLVVCKNVNKLKGKAQADMSYYHSDTDSQRRCSQGPALSRQVQTILVLSLSKHNLCHIVYFYAVTHLYYGIFTIYCTLQILHCAFEKQVVSNILHVVAISGGK